MGADLNSANIAAPGNISVVGAISSSPNIPATGSVAAGGNLSAGTDGLVFVSVSTTATCNNGQVIVYGYAGPGSPVRGQTSVHSGCSGTDYATGQGSFMMPVRKGDVYSVGVLGTGGAFALAVTFIPLGR